MKVQYFFTITAILIFQTLISGQKHDNIWITINPGLDSNSLAPPYPASYIDFNTSPPTISYYACPFPGLETVYTMSNKNGIPLFYSNGYSIFSNDGKIIPNGNGLHLTQLPNAYPFSPPQVMSMMCLPRPGNENDFYVLHLERGPGPFERRLLNITLVTGAKTSGEGVVTYKNKRLFDAGHWLDYFQATRHANGSDWWVVLSNSDPNTTSRIFYTFFIGSDTTYLAHTQQFDIIEPFPYIPVTYRTFTPNGEKLLIADYDKGVYILSFDRCSGLLSNPQFIPLKLSYGVVASPNSQLMYVTSNELVVQFDLNSSDIAATADTVAIYDGFVDTFLGGVTRTHFGMPQVGLDGKVYYMSSTYWHYIARPNLRGKNCNVIQHGLRGPVNGYSISYYPNYRLGPLDGSLCDTLGMDNRPVADFWWIADSTLTVDFTDNSFYEPANWLWDFGDGSAMTQDTNPVHIFPAAGVYRVCLTVSNQYASDSICKFVPVGVLSAQGDENQIDHTKPYIRISPNPADQSFHLDYRRSGSVAQAHLYNIAGRLMYAIRLPEKQGRVTFDTSSLPAGVYFLNITDSGTETVWRKVVLAH